MLTQRTMIFSPNLRMIMLMMTRGVRKMMRKLVTRMIRSLDILRLT